MTKNLLKRPRDPAQLAKLMIDIASGEIIDQKPVRDSTGKNPAAVARHGGWRDKAPLGDWRYC